MSVRQLAEKQPASFEFTPENQAWAAKEIAKYPPGRQASAVIALLWRAQKQCGCWLPKPAIEKVAVMLDMPNIRVLEVATFYTMFNLEPVGRYYVQLCGTTPCMLRGAEDIKAVLRKRVGEPGHVTADGMFSWNEVECLGACCNAPMVQINEDYYEDLTPENFSRLIDDLAAGRPVQKGSQIGRVSSEPVGGLTALTSLYGADGRSGKASAPPPANDPPTEAARLGNDGAADEARPTSTRRRNPERCWKTRIASSPISTASATAASRARGRAETGTEPRGSSPRAATGSSPR